MRTYNFICMRFCKHEEHEKKPQQIPQTVKCFTHTLCSFIVSAVWISTRSPWDDKRCPLSFKLVKKRGIDFVVLDLK